jgi:hypothetical protein
MALPIRDTPILHGKDACIFAENARTAHLRPVSRENYNRAKKIYEEMKKKNLLILE